MNIPNFSQTPCADAITWLEKERDAATAWQNCQRGDWMWWTLRFLPGALPEKEVSVAFAQWCARRATRTAGWAASCAIDAAEAADWAASWAVDAAEAAVWTAAKAAVAAKAADWAAEAADWAADAAEAAKAADWAADAAKAAVAAKAADWAAVAAKAAVVATWITKATKPELVAQADWIRVHIPVLVTRRKYVEEMAKRERVLGMVLG